MFVDGPSQLKEKDAREASLAIDVFGEHVVRITARNFGNPTIALNSSYMD